MNSCVRIVPICDWAFGLFKLTSRFNQQVYCQPCHSRGLATVTGVKHRRTAADLAEKVRQDKKKQTVVEAPISKQQKRLAEIKRYSQQLQRVHPNVLAKHLHKRVLYQDKDVVIINKPHGIPVRGTPSTHTFVDVCVLSKLSNVNILNICSVIS